MNNRNRPSQGNGIYSFDRTPPQTVPANQGAPNYQRPGFVTNSQQPRYQTQAAAQSPRQNSYYHGGSPMEGGNTRQYPPMPTGGISANQHPPAPFPPTLPYTRPQQHFNKFYPNQGGGGGGGTYSTLSQQLPNHQFMYPAVSTYMPSQLQAAPTRYVNPAAAASQPSLYSGYPGQQFIPHTHTMQQYYGNDIRQQQPAPIQLSPAPQPPQPQPSTQSQMAAKTTKPQKSQAITIRDPNTKEDVTHNILSEAKNQSSARPARNSSSSYSSNNNNKASKTDAGVAATFATQVAQAALSGNATTTTPNDSNNNIVAGDNSSASGDTNTKVSTTASSGDADSTTVTAAVSEKTTESESTAAPVSASAAPIEVVEKSEIESLVDSENKSQSPAPTVVTPPVEEPVVPSPVAVPESVSPAPVAAEPEEDIKSPAALAAEKPAMLETQSPVPEVEAPTVASPVPVAVESTTTPVESITPKSETETKPSTQQVASSVTEEVKETKTEEPKKPVEKPATPTPAPATPEPQPAPVEQPAEKPLAPKVEEAPVPVVTKVEEPESIVPTAVVKEEPPTVAAVDPSITPAAANSPVPPVAEDKVVEPATEAPQQSVVDDEEEINGLEDDDLEEGEIVDDDDEESGKVIYERNFLMSLRQHPLSMVKPTGLEQNIPPEIMVNKSINSHLSNNGGMYRDGPVDFTPQFALRGDRDHSNSGGGRQRDRRHQNMQRNYNQHQHHQQQKMVFRRPEAELNKAKNAWKPAKRSAKDLQDEKAKTEHIFREVRSILNKLTPQKFTPLMAAVNALEINTEERLRGVIELVFEKAIDEPNFSEAYANMCRTMSTYQVKKDPEEGSTTEELLEFRKLLLTRCQKEFEKDRGNEEAIKNLTDKIAAFGDKTPADVKQQATEELKLQKTKQRRRMLGNIRFIGELYKLSMLTERIMHSCIKILLTKAAEEPYECLCKLLTTIGGQLDSSNAKASKNKQQNDQNAKDMNQYFIRLKEVIKGKTTSSRVRFMIQDVIDLRQRGWQLRAIQAAGPKTLDEIHADHKNEKEQAAARAAMHLANAHQNAPKNMRSQGGGRHNSRNNNQHQADDGWQKVPSQKSTRYDPNKMRKITTQSQGFSPSGQFDENQVTFAPRGGRIWNARKNNSGSAMTRTGSGGAGPYSSSQRNEQQSGAARSSTPTMMNRFSALNSLPNHEQQPQNNASSRMAQGSSNSSRVPRNDERYRSRESGPTTSMPNSVQSSKKEAIDAARRITSYSTRAPSKSESVPAPISKPVEKPTVPKMDESALAIRHEGIIKEYLHLDSTKEAVECYNELNQPWAGDLFVNTAMQYAVDRKQSDCDKVSGLFVKLLETKILTSDHFMKGAKTLAAESGDLEYDIPRLYQHFAALLAPVIAHTDMTLAHLNEIAEQAKDEYNDGRLKLVVPVLVSLKEIVGMEKLKKDFEKHVDWSCFSDDMSEVKRFLEKNDLMDLESTSTNSMCVPRGGQGESATSLQTTYVKALLDIIKPRTAEDAFNANEVFDKIEAMYGNEVTESNAFVRAACISYVWRSLYLEKACNVCVEDSFLLDRLDQPSAEIEEQKPEEWIINDKWFKGNVVFIQKYCTTGVHKELQTLYAMQYLFLRLSSPSKLLRHIFDQLYDADVVSESQFFIWEKSDDPAESEGKGVALNSARSFFTWLQIGDNISS